MAKKKTTRKRVDWGSIETLYRLGSLSNYQIAEQYAADHQFTQTFKPTVSNTAINKKAKEKKWKKDLAKKVTKRIKEKLVLKDVLDENQNDEGKIDQAAEAGVNLIVRHREEIKALIEHENTLLKELRTATKKVLVGGELQDVKIDLKDRSTILKNITACRKERIALERQAHNIDDEDADKGIEQELMDL